MTTVTGPRTDLLIATTTSLEDTGLLDNLTPYLRGHPPGEPEDHLAGLRQGDRARHARRRRLAARPLAGRRGRVHGAGLRREPPGVRVQLLHHRRARERPGRDQGALARERIPEDQGAGHGRQQRTSCSSRAATTPGPTRPRRASGPRRGSTTPRTSRTPAPGTSRPARAWARPSSIASEKGAYTLTDEATFLAYQSGLKLTPLITQGASLLNIYSAITVVPKGNATATLEAANDYTNFLISDQGQALIADYGKEEYGKPLFMPDDSREGQGVQGRLDDTGNGHQARDRLRGREPRLAVREAEEVLRREQHRQRAGRLHGLPRSP